ARPVASPVINLCGHLAPLLAKEEKRRNSLGNHEYFIRATDKDNQLRVQKIASHSYEKRFHINILN
ncbi:hypothetical protein N9980_01585, partial [bacterium]|nr:hypothetical protein [bacterium]